MIVQAALIAAQTKSDVDRARLFDAPALADFEREGSPSDLRTRLAALRAVLDDLPRYGLRLLRRVEKHARRITRTVEPTPCPDVGRSRVLSDWRLVENRVERPPDKQMFAMPFSTSLRQRAGGEGRWTGGLAF